MIITHALSQWFVALCYGGATIGCTYLLVSLALVVVFCRRDRNGEPGNQQRNVGTSVSILKPLHGGETALLERLGSFCQQDYGAPTEIVFGTQSHDDPAIDVVKSLQCRFPDRDIALVVDPCDHGRHRKVSNLANIMAQAHHDVLVAADSDIHVAPFYLREVVGRLDRRGVGAVTCPYHGVACAGLWSEFAALAINTHFLPNAIIALTLGIAQPCFGATIAMRKELLRKIGGFQTFADYLADDYAVGQAVRLAGYEVAVTSFSVEHACLQRDIRDFFCQHVRVARTIRAIDPVGYLGTVITHPFPLALLAALSGSYDSLVLAAIALSCRFALCATVEHIFQLPRQRYLLIPYQDMLAFAIFVLSFFGTSVSWRGHGYGVTSNGSLLEGNDGGLS
jgi:ceramide glucosyltransferase